MCIHLLICNPRRENTLLFPDCLFVAVDGSDEKETGKDYFPLVTKGTILSG